MITKNNIFDRYLKEYLKATRERKGEILGSVCDVVQVHRKSAIRRFKVLQLKGDASPDLRGRKIYYTPDVTGALKTIWEAASEVSSINRRIRIDLEERPYVGLSG